MEDSLRKVWTDGQAGIYQESANLIRIYWGKDISDSGKDASLRESLVERHRKNCHMVGA